MWKWIPRNDYHRTAFSEKKGGKAKEGRGGFVWEREDDDDLLPKHLVFLLCALNTPRLFIEFTAS